jgi:hypothetical protein
MDGSELNWCRKCNKRLEKEGSSCFFSFFFKIQKKFLKKAVKVEPSRLLEDVFMLETGVG